MHSVRFCSKFSEAQKEEKCMMSNSNSSLLISFRSLKTELQGWSVTLT